MSATMHMTHSPMAPPPSAERVRDAEDQKALRQALHGRGFTPIAVSSAWSDGPSAGKAPYLRNWQNDWSQCPPPAVLDEITDGSLNTGILCRGLRVFDVDIDDPEIAEVICDIITRIAGPAPRRTRRGSTHVALFYRAADGNPPKRAVSAPKVQGCPSQKLEVLGDGQQVVVFGTHPSGVRYCFSLVQGQTFSRDALVPVTEDQVARILQEVSNLIGAQAPPTTPSSPRSGGGRPGASPPDPACLAALEAVIAEMPNPLKFDRSRALAMAHAIKAAFESDLERGRAAFVEWEGRWEGSVVEGEGERIYDSLGDDHNVGVGWLIGTAADLGVDVRSYATATAQAEFIATEDAPKVESPSGQGAKSATSNSSNIDLTEDGVALAFCADFEGRYVFDHTENEWFCWRGSRWESDKIRQVWNAAREFTRTIRETNPKAPNELARIKFTWAIFQASKADPRMAVSNEVWNTDPFLLGVPSGVLDLRTGQTRPGRPRDYISKCTAVDPAAPGHGAPLWLRFLNEATACDQSMIGFLQRLAGYVLTGDVTEEVLCFLYGPGGNGKGVFLGALVAILNDYAVSAPAEVFTAGARTNLDYQRAAMVGARLVTASETEQGATWAESLIKELTGNETPLPARHPYGRAFQFRSQAKIVIVGNHAPALRGRSAAMQRRMRVLPFTQAPANPDPTLKERLRAEYPAILRWAIEGCIAWQSQRLGSCPAIEAATSGYLETQDTLAHWMAECCDVGTAHSSKPGILLESYRSFARANGEADVTGPAFKEMLDRVPGLRRGSSHGVILVRGIAVRDGAAAEFDLD